MTNGLEKAKMAITEVCEALKTSDAIPRAIDAFRDFLLEKNKAYGNSIYEPVRVFTMSSVDSLILVRLNDKATRLLKGESGGEDSYKDLLGYLILREALPLYLEGRAGSELRSLASAVAEGGGRPRMVPHSEVQAHLASRGLRVGMTFEEVRANPWTQCEADEAGTLECTEGDPCGACKFLDAAMCKCGHPFTVHGNELASFATYCGPCGDACEDFSLASWTATPPYPTMADAIGMANAIAPALPPIALAEEQLALRRNCGGDPCACDWGAPHGVDPSEGIRTQSEERNAMLAAETEAVRAYAVSIIKELGAGGASMHLGVSTPDLLVFASNGDEGPTCEKIRQHKARVENPGAADPPAKKPRIKRATWHESEVGRLAIFDVMALLSTKPLVSWSMHEFNKVANLDPVDVGLALEYLISTGSVDKHGKAKGTRYALTGFTDWPAPRPRKATETPPEPEADQ